MTQKNDLIIAVDGYSSCGKSTFAKAIAHELKYLYIDSGAMYRAVTLFCLENKLIIEGKVDYTGLTLSLDSIIIEFIRNTSSGLNETFLNGENVEEKIRSLEVSQNVSQVSQISEVRRKLVSLQREIGMKKGIVMDGRDIGTVVFPHADLKIFMIADPHVRAIRRYKEMVEKRLDVDLAKIEENIRFRDKLDESREDSPLKKASDAVLLDNTYMTPSEQIEWFREITKK